MIEECHVMTKQEQARLARRELAAGTLQPIPVPYLEPVARLTDKPKAAGRWPGFAVQQTEPLDIQKILSGRQRKMV